MKMPSMKSPSAKMPKTPSIGGGGGKPHIRARKLKPVAPSAFPASAAAFPASDAPASPDAAMSAAPGGMSAGGAPGDMGE